MTVWRARPDPHGYLADGQISQAMLAGGARHAEARHRLGDDALALAHREGLEGFVFQAPHLRALVVIAHPPLKASEAAAGGLGQRRAQARAVDGGAGEAKGMTRA